MATKKAPTDLFKKPGILLILLFVIGQHLLANDIAIMAEPHWLYKVSPNPIKPQSAETVSDGYYLELVDQQVNLANESSFGHFIRHIINEAGVQNASEISVSFDPAYQKVVFHKITLIRNGKMINQLRFDQIRVVQEETDAESFQYNGTKRAFVILKGIQKDDRIDYSYSVIGFNPVFKNRFTDKVYFTASENINSYFQTYIVPADRNLVFKNFNDAAKPLEIRQDNLIIYHWSNPPLKLYESQSQTPGWFNNYPYVSISEFKNWNDVANWGLNLFNNYKYEIPAELKSKINGWRAIAKGNKEMFANLATRFVQDDIRYLGMEAGVHSHKPHLPADVFQQRYGDCKDKALLLATILRQEDIPAYVALVSTVNGTQLQSKSPSTYEFNHAIVAVQRSSGFLYIDATMNYQRGEFSTTFIPNYGFALLIKEGEDNLQPIEPGYPNTSDITERMILPFKDSSRLLVTTTYKGGAADKFRADVAETSLKDLTADCLRYYVKMYDGIRQVQNVETSDDSLRNEFELKEEYVMPALWKENDKGKISVDVYAKSVTEKIPDPTGAYSEGPLAIEFPLTVKYVLSLELDEKWGFDVEDLHIKTSSYQFDFTSEVNGSQVELKYYYKTFKDHIPQNEVAEYKNAYKKIEGVLSFNFSKPGSLSTNKSNPAPVTHWPMVYIFVLTLGGMLLLFRKLDSFKSNEAFAPTIAENLGGWVIILGLSLLVGLLSQLWALVSADYFDLALWSSLGESYGKFFQFVLVVEMVYAAISSSFLIFLLYWFFKRRDIFPKMFIGYVIGMILGQFLLLALYTVAHNKNSAFELQDEHIIQLVQSIIYGAVWTSFVYKSVRVKNTFVVQKHDPG